MASLEKMQARTDDIKVSWGEETVLVRWKPGKLNDAFMEELAGIYDEATSGKLKETMPRVRGKLAELLAWWDLTEKEGPEDPKTNPMVPLTSDGLARIPSGLLLRITREILDEAEGGEVSGRTDSGGPAAAPSGTNPAGQHSFG